MPTYVYKCENGHTHESIQKITDPPSKVCPVYFVPKLTPNRIDEVFMCNRPVFRVIQKTSFTIK